MSWLNRGPKLPPPEKVDKGDLLTFLGFGKYARPRGFWVYALHEADGTVFRVGQSAEESASSWLGRLYEHIYTYKERFDHYSLIECRDAHQADTYEAMLGEWYQPAECYAGTAEVEALRRRIRQSKNGGGLPGRADSYRKTG